jgi:hypothetical protein
VEERDRCEVHLKPRQLSAKCNYIRGSAGNLYKRPIHKPCLIATKEEFESGLPGETVKIQNYLLSLLFKTGEE